MYLYYKDYKGKLLLNVFGLQIYLIMHAVHLIRYILQQFYHDNERIQEISDFEDYFVYSAVELVASAVMTYTRITDDLFLQLNRERNILKISIFQYDHLKEIRPKSRQLIKSACDAKSLRNEIDAAKKIDNRRSTEQNSSFAQILTNSFINHELRVQHRSTLRLESQESVLFESTMMDQTNDIYEEDESCIDAIDLLNSSEIRQ